MLFRTYRGPIKTATECFEMSSPQTKNRSADETLLDAQSKAILDAVEAADAPHFLDLSPEELRRGHEAFFMPLSLKDNTLTTVEERTIPGPDSDIRLRIYSPKTPHGNTRSEPLPVTLFFHGGGMMVGSLELYDTICQRLCDRSGIIIISVDYRLAPEHKYPCAINDSYAALVWTQKNAHTFGGGPEKLAVAGDSAGGMLAAVMTQMCRDHGGPKLAFQLLIYPAVGKRREYGSYREFAKGYFGEPGQLAWFYAQFLTSPEQMDDPRVSPILADDFSSLPPAFILSAGYDILRDEAEHYAELLAQAGVPTELHRYESSFHPFLNAAGVIDVGKQAIDECAQKLAAALF